jgi:hypothetical protein
MALVGGGGAGNVAGSNPAGTGTSLHYISNGKVTHAYAYSGVLQVDNNATTLLEFSTGNQYIVATWQIFMAETNAADNYRYDCYIDDQIIATLQTTSATEYTPYEEVELILPPFATVKITGRNSTDTSNNGIGSNITGRVY